MLTCIQDCNSKLPVLTSLQMVASELDFYRSIYILYISRERFLLSNAWRIKADSRDIDLEFSETHACQRSVKTDFRLTDNLQYFIG